jgi:hypothetical protein
MEISATDLKPSSSEGLNQPDSRMRTLGSILQDIFSSSVECLPIEHDDFEEQAHHLSINRYLHSVSGEMFRQRK